MRVGQGGTGRKDSREHEEKFEGDEYIHYHYISLYISSIYDAVLKPIKLYTLNMCSLLYVTYTSIAVKK